MKNLIAKVKDKLGMNKRGIASQTGVVAFVMGLGAVVIGVGVTVLVLDAFNSSTTNGAAQGVFGNGITLFSNFTGQLPTIGTIAGILLLVVLVALAGIGAYQYGSRRGMF